MQIWMTAADDRMGTIHRTRCVLEHASRIDQDQRAIDALEHWDAIYTVATTTERMARHSGCSPDYTHLDAMRMEADCDAYYTACATAKKYLATWLAADAKAEQLLPDFFAKLPSEHVTAAKALA